MLPRWPLHDDNDAVPVETDVAVRVGLSVGQLYSAIKQPPPDGPLRLQHFVPGAPVRVGPLPISSEAGRAILPSLSGPVGRTDAARAIFQNASQHLIEIGNHWNPVRLLGYNPAARVPLPEDPDMLAVETRTLREASALLSLGGVRHVWDRTTASITIEANDETPLGRFAQLLSDAGTQLRYCPAMLFNQKSVAAFNAAGFLFLSNQAIAELKPGAPEAHETIHAVLSHVLNGLGGAHPFVGQLMPIAGGSLFDPGDDYTRGFSMEELLTTACDLLEDAKIDPIRAVQQHVSTWDRGRMPRAVQASCRRFIDGLSGSSMSFERRLSSYYLDATQLVESGASLINPARPVWSADVGGFSVELTTHHLTGRDQRVVSALLIDPENGRQLEIPVVDPRALERLDGGADLGVIVAEYVMPHLAQLERIAAHQSAIYDRLAAGESALEDLASTLIVDLDLTR